MISVMHNALEKKTFQHSHRQNRTPQAQGTLLILTITTVLFAVLIILPPAKGFAKSAHQLEQDLQTHVQLPQGYKISLFATGLVKPRLMIETTKGDLIVSSYGPKIFLVSADRDKDGRADKIRVLMSGLNQPHGVLLDKDWLYIAEQHRVTRIRFNADKAIVYGTHQTIVPRLPNNGGHSSRTLKKGPDGWFYLSIGSSCNVCRERHKWRATIIRFHPHKNAKPEIFATGLRNTVGFDWQPGTNDLYGVDNGRDWLGDNFPPDELNNIKKGGFYGWPYRHGNNILDPKFGRQFHGSALKPSFAFEAHIAPLSIRFLRHQKAPQMNNTALVAQHGSWNRSTKNGYRIVSLRFNKDGTVNKKMFLTGFLSGKGRHQKVIGRPVDVFERSNGDLLISDDYNGVIWRVQYSEQKPD